MNRSSWLSLALLLVVAVLVGALVGGGSGDDGDDDAARVADADRTVTVTEVSRGGRTRAVRSGSFDPQALYEREAPGVVTIYSLFTGGGALGQLLGGTPDEDAAGQGSGFVVSSRGEIATNAHVVTTGEGPEAKRAREVYVEFADGNRVPARIVGHDLNSDVALLRIEPGGLDLDPLPLGRSRTVSVGEPVVAIGSPFGERQSLSIGVVSAIDRDIRSLTAFGISGAVQTDAAINKGNSGGPLVNSRGEVIGINAQIQSQTGDGTGVGFAIPVDLVKRVIGQLRSSGKASYAYLGVSTVPIYPQLADHFKLPVKSGAWVQTLNPGAPAEEAGIHGGGARETRFQTSLFRTGGDIITRIGPHEIKTASDLSEAVAALDPGAKTEIELYRDGKRQTRTIELRERPLTKPSARPR